MKGKPDLGGHILIASRPLVMFNSDTNDPDWLESLPCTLFLHAT